MSNNPVPPIADRIHRTLTRLGFNDCTLQGVHDGQITLFCPEIDRNDHGLIRVALRLLPGIQSVVFLAHPQQEEKS